jgi:hypothetical protein
VCHWLQIAGWSDVQQVNVQSGSKSLSLCRVACRERLEVSVEEQGERAGKAASGVWLVCRGCGHACRTLRKEIRQGDEISLCHTSLSTTRRLTALRYLRVAVHDDDDLRHSHSSAAACTQHYHSRRRQAHKCSLSKFLGLRDGSFGLPTATPYQADCGWSSGTLSARLYGQLVQTSASHLPAVKQREVMTRD